MWGTNLGISDLSIGVSKQGMETYREEVKLEMFDNTINTIRDNFQEVVDAINLAWQGKSRDKFVESMDKKIEQICTDLESEKKDLDNRLQELEDNYFKEDENLMQ